MTGATAERNKNEQLSSSHTEVLDRNKRFYAPLADIYETEESFCVLADMPGVDEASIDITLEKNVLTIEGLTPCQQEQGLRQILCETPEGNYRRVFLLSEEVDRDGIEATIKNGVLKVILPKSPKSKARKISVKSD